VTMQIWCEVERGGCANLDRLQAREMEVVGAAARWCRDDVRCRCMLMVNVVVRERMCCWWKMMVLARDGYGGYYRCSFSGVSGAA